ncbi:MAG TPA: GNAT family N-acetyltransferase [Candidatus Dormibacteraeota bacterium]|nr:GNAT family N-acetyltransferase [Candidatus Dormibacteraeota bacterium]
MANGHLEDDAKRFQAWQLDALNKHPAGTELRSVGPFRAIVPAANQPGGWVTIVEGTVTDLETQAAVADLRAMFEQRNTLLEIEYNEALFPGVGGWLEAGGLTLAERNPLMACRPDRFRPLIAPDVILRRLTPASEEADMLAFQTVRWTDGGDEENRAVPPVEQLRQEVAAASSVYLLAWLGGEPAGTGVSHAMNGVGEVVGVVTRSDKRRRGVAATVTSELVSRHFAAGGDFVFLDAADEAAARLYERLGFRRFGANLVYR